MSTRAPINAPIRALIVDDETSARERLRRMLADNSEIVIVGEARSGLEAVGMIEALQPDLLFLDIQMPGLDGFEVVEALTNPPLIIFVTAYDEYAIRAFEINALDYLLKPFSQARLTQAVERARETLAEEHDFDERLPPLLASLGAHEQYMTRLAVRDRDSIRVLSVDEVDWIGVESDQVMIYVGDQAYPIRRTLAELEARLDPARFFRAHRSAIVNLDRVQEIIPWFAGGHKLRLTTGAEVDLSRARTRALRELLKW